MGVRTGKAFLASLRDERCIHIDGERVTDVTQDPRFAGAAQSLADLYDMQHDPTLAPRMTFASSVDGAPVGLSFIAFATEKPSAIMNSAFARFFVENWCMICVIALVQS